LFWCEIGKREMSANRCISLSQITDVYIGKQTKAFEKYDARKALDIQCFSIQVGQKRTLDLEAQNKEIRDSWVVGIKQILLQSNGKNTTSDSERDRTLTVHPSRIRMLSQSVASGQKSSKNSNSPKNSSKYLQIQSSLSKPTNATKFSSLQPNLSSVTSVSKPTSAMKLPTIQRALPNSLPDPNLQSPVILPSTYSKNAVPSKVFKHPYGQPGSNKPTKAKYTTSKVQADLEKPRQPNVFKPYNAVKVPTPQPTKPPLVLEHNPQSPVILSKKARSEIADPSEISRQPYGQFVASQSPKNKSPRVRQFVASPSPKNKSPRARARQFEASQSPKNKSPKNKSPRVGQFVASQSPKNKSPRSRQFEASQSPKNKYPRSRQFEASQSPLNKSPPVRQFVASQSPKNESPRARVQTDVRVGASDFSSNDQVSALKAEVERSKNRLRELEQQQMSASQPLPSRRVNSTKRRNKKRGNRSPKFKPKPPPEPFAQQKPPSLLERPPPRPKPRPPLQILGPPPKPQPAPQQLGPPPKPRPQPQSRPLQPVSKKKTPVRNKPPPPTLE